MTTFCLAFGGSYTPSSGTGGGDTGDIDCASVASQGSLAGLSDTCENSVLTFECSIFAAQCSNDLDCVEGKMAAFCLQFGGSFTPSGGDTGGVDCVALGERGSLPTLTDTCSAALFQYQCEKHLDTCGNDQTCVEEYLTTFAIQFGGCFECSCDD
eukprot:CAMPEP_0113858822 /NCGR_PEP_ID=MMETSP0372-20130328/11626_1 /TAXON_ID=340204 /ORGANISM="Lankesteria abbotti" /LENGTH=154 /DNA_ID=CAMNT_0000836219 /DNA_START=611 /DNA_END=1075 /DNA_ORIENTATION=- /assembly_acc=CAM_ASM_000359